MFTKGFQSRQEIKGGVQMEVRTCFIMDVPQAFQGLVKGSRSGAGCVVIMCGL